MKKFKNNIINLNNYAALNFSTNTFVKFWNLIFFVTRNRLRFKAIENDNILVEDSNYKFIISQKLRAWFYFKSLENRFESLGKMYFFDKIQFSKNDIIIDCGSNIGEIYYSLKIFNKENFEYYGFEPVESEFKILEINTANKIKSPVALFDKNEIKRLYVHKEGADSTLLKDSRYGESEYADCKRLDSINNLTGKKIKLLKLEAEGAELQVLIGCGNVLKNIEYISADLGFELEEGTKSNQEEVVKFLNNNNFENIDSNSRSVNLFKNRDFINL